MLYVVHVIVLLFILASAVLLWYEDILLEKAVFYISLGRIAFLPFRYVNVKA